MTGFHQIQDVYFDCLNLCEVLESIPQTCDCLDADSHLAGKCCCASSWNEVGEEGISRDGNPLSLEKLRRSVNSFQKDFDQERAQLSSPEVTNEFGSPLSLIEDTVRSIARSVERVEDNLNSFRSSCAQDALERLKAQSLDLRKYLDQLNNPPFERAVRVITERHTSGRSGRSDVALKNSQAPLEGITAEVFARQTVSASTTDDLKELARKHGVCYEVWPEWSLVGNERIKIGYVLELYGANSHEQGRKICHLVPGCRSCRETFEDMKKIAEWIMPREERVSRYELEPFNRVIHIAPKQRKLRSEVVLTVKILHRSEINQPVDDCEQRCLKEMRGKLNELGILEGVCRS